MAGLIIKSDFSCKVAIVQKETQNWKPIATVLLVQLRKVKVKNTMLSLEKALKSLHISTSYVPGTKLLDKLLFLKYKKILISWVGKMRPLFCFLLTNIKLSI